jgi:hypothetical protein
MQLFKYRVPADDAEIFDACTRRPALRAENYSEGILLSGLPLYLDEPRRAYNWTPLASVLPWKRSRTGLIRLPDTLAAAEIPLPTMRVILTKAKNVRSSVWSTNTIVAPFHLPWMTMSG